MLFNLSLRYKMPLWGSVLILTTAIALSSSFIAQTWGDLRHDMLRTSEDLGRAMARSLFGAMLHDDLWRAFEIVSMPVKETAEATLGESLLVVDSARKVYVSSHPELYPVLSDLHALGDDFRELDRRLLSEPAAQRVVLDTPEMPHIFVALPIVNDGVQLGTLIVAHEKSWLWERFSRLIERTIWVTLIALTILLPINWYWGARITAPLRFVTRRLTQISQGEPAALDPDLYPYRDEIGQLYIAYGHMAEELREKMALKQEIVKNERMAAVGRLTASIAHEINNPLGGMLNAISTLRRFGNPDPQTQKTIGLLERGLSQIKETVAALLVEAKVNSRHLAPSDLDDVRILVSPSAHKLCTRMDWHLGVDTSLPLPSTLVRQVLINLTLNAIHAAGKDGQVNVRAGTTGRSLVLRIENDGKQLSEEQQQSLFEPFSRFSESGHGLGLWICYQIVTQLDGTIEAATDNHLTVFTVSLPLEPTLGSDQPPSLPH